MGGCECQVELGKLNTNIKNTLFILWGGGGGAPWFGMVSLCDNDLFYFGGCLAGSATQGLRQAVTGSCIPGAEHAHVWGGGGGASMWTLSLRDRICIWAGGRGV